jgi:tRNA (Thr-GGU) A37 N-methylase
LVRTVARFESSDPHVSPGDIAAVRIGPIDAIKGTPVIDIKPAL